MFAHALVFALGRGLEMGVWAEIERIEMIGIVIAIAIAIETATAVVRE